MLNGHFCLPDSFFLSRLHSTAVYSWFDILDPAFPNKYLKSEVRKILANILRKLQLRVPMLDNKSRANSFIWNSFEETFHNIFEVDSGKVTKLPFYQLSKSGLRRRPCGNCGEYNVTLASAARRSQMRLPFGCWEDCMKGMQMPLTKGWNHWCNDTKDGLTDCIKLLFVNQGSPSCRFGCGILCFQGWWVFQDIDFPRCTIIIQDLIKNRFSKMY